MWSTHLAADQLAQNYSARTRGVLWSLSIVLGLVGSAIEAYANAFDAERIGAGRMVSTLDLGLLNEFLPNYRPKHDAYVAWMNQATPKILYHLENPLARSRCSIIASLHSLPAIAG